MALINEEIEKLRAIEELNNSLGKVVEDFVPPGKPMEHECERYKLDRHASKAIVGYSEEHTVREAAEKFGVSTRTVRRHRNHWLRGGDEVKLEVDGYVTSRQCGVMREMARDGINRRRIAEKFDRSWDTINRHVTGECSCETGVPEVTYG